MREREKPTKIGGRAAAATHGVRATHEQMPSGELRFRLMSADGNGYIQTRAVSSQWQNSHYHDHTAETYIVERGWMLMAIETAAGRADFWRFEPGQAVTTPVGKAHNIFMPAGAVIHTVKHGCGDAARDWNAAPQLDAMLNSLGADVMEMGRLAPPGLVL